MSDQLLKSVRITDNIKVEVYQQGKRRKYTLFNDNDQTKSLKYDVAMSDDDVIKESLLEYGRLQKSKGKISGQMPQFYYKVIQDPYKDPLPVRTYGNGDKSPYYLNNGCAINIKWVGKIPNPEFNPGTYSNLYEAQKDGKKDGKPRYLENVTITAKEDAADKTDILPKSSWSVSPPVTDGLFDPEVVPVDYRDTSYVFNKEVTVTLPTGFTENGGKGYLVWTDNGLKYNDDKDVYTSSEDKGRKIGSVIIKFPGNNKDSEIVEHIIASFVGNVTHLHGYDGFQNVSGLKLCSPDTEACSLIPYKSPLQAPSNNEIVAQQTPSPTQSVPKIKLTIDGLGDDIQLKALTNLEDFTVWAGPIPKSIELIDDFEDLAEYVESPYKGYEEEPAIFESQSYESEEVRKATEANASFVNSSGRGATYPNYVAGKHKLDMIPGEFKGNGGVLIKCCQIHGKPVNVAIADALLDMIEAAKNDGVNLTVSSGFRPGFDPSISTKSERGVNVSAQSQEDLYRIYLRDKKPDTAKPGYSRHGNGIAIDFNTGARTGKFSPLNTKNYVWMVKNSWRFGFLRSVASEEWHYEYWPEDAKNGPYAKLGKSNPLFFADLGLNNLQAPNWA